MKRTALYVITAVLLGIAMMIMPLWFSWASQVTFDTEEKNLEDFTEALLRAASTPERWEDAQRDSYQVSHKPTAAYEGVEIFAVGFILALAARFIIKRRAPYPRFPIRPV